jgi:hypothetical protein
MCTRETDPLEPDDLKQLCAAARLLENPGFFIRLVNWLGKPVEAVLQQLPAPAEEVIQRAVRVALRKALDLALYRFDDGWGLFRHERAMQAFVGVTGATSGFLGLETVPLELPISTSAMLRSIAEIARSEGDDIRSVESKLACLEVFALGGRSTADDSSETGYYAVRIALGREVSAAVKFLAEGGDRATGPVIVKLIEAVAQRFGIQVSEKAAAQSVPVIGAVGGATVNVLFMDHFQDMAHGHFVVRRLERKYSRDRVRAEYLKCVQRMKAEHER